MDRDGRKERSGLRGWLLRGQTHNTVGEIPAISSPPAKLPVCVDVGCDGRQDLWNACFGRVKNVGNASNVRFRDLDGADIYVPTIASSLFRHPFLAADISKVDIIYLIVDIV